MEKDDEVKGTGNSMNYKARIQDTRLGRFLSIDPLTMQFPHYSPYQFAGNKPIKYIDLDGKEPTDPQLYWKPLPQLEIKLEGENRADVEYFATVGIHSSDQLFEGPGKMIVARWGKNYGYWDKGKKSWVQFDPNKIGWSAEEATKATTYSLGATAAIVGGLVVADAVGWGVVAEEIGEEIFERVTGIPVLMDPKDLLELGFKKVLRKQVKEQLVEKYGKKAIDGSGSYTVTYKDGTKYHGKGNLEEAISGASRKSNGDEVINLDWSPSKNNSDSFVDEAKRLNTDGGYKSKTNRNERDSPGNRKYKDDYDKKYGN
jgi:RHS repeat-associated protein